MEPNSKILTEGLKSEAKKYDVACLEAVFTEKA